MRKPVDVTYGLNDRPPLTILLSAALQQTAVVVVVLYPAIIVARELELAPAAAAALLSVSLVVGALSTVLQCLGRWGVGSGYLAPSCCSVIAIAPAILAARSGGLALVAGMTFVAGVATVVLAQLLSRLRAWLPPEIAGVVAIIVGLAVSLTGVRLLARTPELDALAVALVTLAIVVGLSVWGKGLLRLTCLLSALVIGTLVAFPLGLLHAPGDFDVGSLPVVGLPDFRHAGWAFDFALLPVFLIVALASALKTVGLVTTLQKINDADWVRPEPRSVAGGVTGEGVAMMLSGALGAAPAQTMAITPITVQAATGVTSRVVGYATAAICLVLACFPRAAAALSLVPGPVLAGMLLQTGGLMLVNGMQVATSRMLDTRKAFAVGLALVAAIGVEAVPGAGDLVPDWLRPLMTATALGTLVALLLNAVLRIGIRKQVTMTVPPGEVPHVQLTDFITRAGRSWGARPDVIARTAELSAWCVDAIVGHRLAEGEVTVALGFDELRIDLQISYRGPPLDLAATPPTAEELLADDGGAAKLAGYMIGRRATRARIRQRDGTTQLSVAIDH